MSDKYARSMWFRRDRFGMFIHWGAYSVTGRGEWVRQAEKLTAEQYQPAVDAFVPDRWDPEAWADLAVEAGMKYAVLTAKHHDGFCLFDSALSTYTVMHNGYGRDVVAEFVTAFRARGLKVGLYFSLIDWSHPDYPAYSDMFHPLQGDPAVRDAEHDFDRYLDYMHGQITELCTGYGALDILWFDFSYDTMRADTWRADKIMEIVRTHQPQVIMDNRLETSGEGFGSLVTADPTPWSGDFVSPEQIIPPSGILDSDGAPVPWEACVTLNNNWGYVPHDRDYKSPTTIIRKLTECVSKGGNLLLNVGPDARGNVPEESADRLREIGRWLRRNGSGIYGCTAADLPKPEWGRYTTDGTHIFAHVTEQPVGPLPLTGLDKHAIKNVTLVADGSLVPLVSSWVVESYPDLAFVNFGPVPQFTYPLPDERDTVLRIELNPERSS